MENLYMDIIKFFTQFGWQMTVLAVSGIFLLGVLKMSGAFSKVKIYVKDKNGTKVISEKNTIQFKKFLYMFISVLLSVAACSVYLYIRKEINIVFIATLTIPVFGLNQIAYGIYENLGVRTVWKMLLDKIKQAVKAKKGNQVSPELKLAGRINKLANKYKTLDTAKALNIISQTLNKK